MKLAEQIKKYRKEQGLTQDQLAAQLHPTRQTVSKWVQDSIEPNAQMIVNLAQMFNITTDELLTGENMSNFTKELNETGTDHLNFWDFLSQKWWFVLAIVVIVCGTLSQIFAG